MKLKIIGTGSKGNAYILENENEALLIECGVDFKKVKQALNFNLNKVVGCILTHEHGDHAKSILHCLEAGLTIWSGEKTHEKLQTTMHHNSGILKPEKIQKIGGFKILPFLVEHDAAEPLGFLINHAETGNILFLTDTFYCKNTFRNLNNIIIEANYSKKIIDDKVSNGASPQFLRDRILMSHLSLENCMELLIANDLSSVNNIVLIHLSDSNSNAKGFKSAIEKLTGKTVTIADSGMTIENFNKTPF